VAGTARTRLGDRALDLWLSSNNLGQVVHTHVPLSPSSIIWYRCAAKVGCELVEVVWSAIMAAASPLPGQDHWNGDVNNKIFIYLSTAPWRHMVCLCTCAVQRLFYNKSKDWTAISSEIDSISLPSPISCYTKCNNSHFKVHYSKHWTYSPSLGISWL